jgi:hypothetical protein
MSMGVPEPGQVVCVRRRQYLVEEVVPPPNPADQTLVRLSCLDDDAQGQELEALWEKEVEQVLVIPRVTKYCNFARVPARQILNEKVVVLPLARRGPRRSPRPPPPPQPDGPRVTSYSANFTEAAQERNIEAGILVGDPAFARALRDQFESLVEARQLLRVPGLQR